MDHLPLSTHKFPTKAVADKAHRMSSPMYCDWLKRAMSCEVENAQDRYPDLPEVKAVVGLDSPLPKKALDAYTSDQYHSDVLQYMGETRLVTLNKQSPDTVLNSTVLHDMEHQAALYIIALLQNESVSFQRLLESTLQDKAQHLTEAHPNTRITGVNPSVDMLYLLNMSHSVSKANGMHGDSLEFFKDLVTTACPHFWMGSEMAADFELSAREGYALRYSLFIELGITTLMTQCSHWLQLQMMGELPRVKGLRGCGIHGVSTNFNELLTGTLLDSQTIHGEFDKSFALHHDISLFLQGVENLKFVKEVTIKVPYELTSGLILPPKAPVSLEDQSIMLSVINNPLPSTTSAKFHTSLDVIAAFIRNETQQAALNGDMWRADGQHAISPSGRKITWGMRAHVTNHEGLAKREMAIVNALWLGSTADPLRATKTNNKLVLSRIKSAVGRTPPVLMNNLFGAFSYLQPLFGMDHGMYGVSQPADGDNRNRLGTASTGMAIPRLSRTQDDWLLTESIVPMRGAVSSRMATMPRIALCVADYGGSVEDVLHSQLTAVMKHPLSNASTGTRGELFSGAFYDDPSMLLDMSFDNAEENMAALVGNLVLIPDTAVAQRGTILHAVNNVGKRGDSAALMSLAFFWLSMTAEKPVISSRIKAMLSRANMPDYAVPLMTLIDFIDHKGHLPPVS